MFGLRCLIAANAHLLRFGITQTNLAIAFDLMRVNRHTFAELYRVFPVLQLLFESDDDDPAADTSSAVLDGAT